MLLHQHAYCKHSWRRINRKPLCPAQARGLQPCSPSATMWCRGTSPRRSWAPSQRRAPWPSPSPTFCCQRCVESLQCCGSHDGFYVNQAQQTHCAAAYLRTRRRTEWPCCCFHTQTREEPCSFTPLEAMLYRPFAASTGFRLRIQIQAVARPPAALNGRKGVTAAFSTIGIIYPLVAVSGFYVRA